MITYEYNDFKKMIYMGVGGGGGGISSNPGLTQIKLYILRMTWLNRLSDG